MKLTMRRVLDTMRDLKGEESHPERKRLTEAALKHVSPVGHMALGLTEKVLAKYAAAKTAASVVKAALPADRLTPEVKLIMEENLLVMQDGQDAAYEGLIEKEIEEPKARAEFGLPPLSWDTMVEIGEKS